MKNSLPAVLVLALLVPGCAKKPEVDVTHNQAVAAVQIKPRSEPIFFNGKTYQLDFAPSAEKGLFDMAVSGMGPKQQKDAVQLATSSLGYYACPDGQRGALQGSPSYAGGRWKLRARCA
jgi:hypothetical protein